MSSNNTDNTKILSDSLTTANPGKPGYYMPIVAKSCDVETKAVQSCSELSCSAQPVAAQPVAAQSVTAQPTFEFKEGVAITREDFPSVAQFKRICEINNFNRLLDMLKQRMILANNSNQPYARVVVSDYSCFPAGTVTEVKSFLVEKGYRITEIEDANGNPQGWKWSW